MGPLICKFVFNKYTYSEFHIHVCIQPIVDRKQYFRSVPGNPQMQMLYCVILYNVLEHLQIWESAGVPGTNPLWLLRGDYSYDLEESNVIHIDLLLYGGQCL